MKKGSCCSMTRCRSTSPNLKIQKCSFPLMRKTAATRLSLPKMKVLGTFPLRHQPGEKFTYGLNSDVLGYVVEVVSGMNLDAFFQKRIFEPLGMNDTYFYVPKEKQNRLVT